MNAAKQYVEAGLERRKADRQEREQEEKLDAYEAEMISFCNRHSADSKKTQAEKVCATRRRLRSIRIFLASRSPSFARAR